MCVPSKAAEAEVSNGGRKKAAPPLQEPWAMKRSTDCVCRTEGQPSGSQTGGNMVFYFAFQRAGVEREILLASTS